jgi:hypothetical protein
MERQKQFDIFQFDLDFDSMHLILPVISIQLKK